MADAGGDYLYTFGFNFETAGLDQLLSAIENFSSRAQAGFGSSMALPEGVTSPAASPEGIVPLSAPTQVEAATAGIEAGLKAYVSRLDLTTDQIKRVNETINASMASMRRAGGAYAQKAEPSGVLYGPGGEVLVHPQEQARLRLMEAGRQAATAKGRAEQTVEGPIQALLPPPKKVQDFEYIVNPANRAELNEAIAARAKLFQQERLFASLDNAEKQKEIAYSQENTKATADEALARRSVAALLKAEELDLTKKGGEYAPVRDYEVTNRLEQERQAQADQLLYLKERDQPVPTPGGKPGEYTSATEQDAAIKLAQERDRVTTSLKYYAQKTDEDREALGEEKVAREDDAIAIRAHAVRMREQQQELLEQRQAQAVQISGERGGISFEELDKIGVPYDQRLGKVQAEEEMLAAEVKSAKTVVLLGSQDYEDDMALVSANNRELASDIKLAAENILAGDTEYVKTVAEGNQAQQLRVAQENAQTNQLLAVNEDFIKARAEGAVAAERTALQVRMEEGGQRQSLAQDPRGGIDIIKLRGQAAAFDRVDAAATNLAEIETLQAASAEYGLALEKVKQQELNAAIEKRTLGIIASTEEGDKTRDTEIANRLTRERMARSDEARYLQGRQAMQPTGNTDITQVAAVQLAREEDAASVALSRHAQQTEQDRSTIASVQNAREDEKLAVEEHARQLRQQQDLEVSRQRAASREQGVPAPPDLTHAERLGGAAAEREFDAADVELQRARAQQNNLLYQGTVSEATEIQRKQNAQIEEEIQATLAADEQYIEARGNTAAFVRERTSKERALSEALLSADEEYIKAVASATVSQRETAAKITAQTRTDQEKSGFDFAGAAAQENVKKQLENAQTQLAQSKLVAGLGAGERIDLVKGGAGAASDKAILDAQINSQLQETLRESTSYKDATAKAAAVKKLLAAEIEAETVDQMEQRAAREGTTAASILASGTVKRQALAEETKLEVLQQQLQLEREKLAAGEQSLTAQRLATQKQLQILQRQGAQREFQTSGLADTGTRFQRAQAQIDISRTGQLRAPEEYQTLGSFFGQRALNTFGYLTSGIAFYGLFDQLKQAMTEATAVQKEMEILRSTFTQTDQAGKFDDTRNALLDIANETGQLGSVATNVFRQLYGAFGQDIPAALEATKQSLKFSQVTGLDPKEINDSVTAIALSFGQVDVTPFLDQAIKLEQVFGVLPQETIQFAADLAPLAEQMGFTANQLEAFGAAAQAVSGKTGGALAEQLSRVFEVFTDPTKMVDMAAVLDRDLPQAVGAFTSAVANGNVEQAFEVILKNLDELDKTAPQKAKNIRDALVNVAGGPRQAGALAAIFQQPGLTLDALQGKTGDATGALDQRFKQLQDSLAQTFSKIQRGVESLMQAILQAGVGDVLVKLGQTMATIIDTATTFLEIFGKINDMFGGLPGQIITVIAVVKTLSLALEAVQRLGILNVLLGPLAQILPGLAGAAAGAGAVAEGAAGAAAEGGVKAVATEAGAETVATFGTKVGTIVAGEKVGEKGAGVIGGAVSAATATEGGLLSAEGVSAGLGALGASLSGFVAPLAIAFAAYKGVQFVQHIKDVNDKANEASKTFDEQVKADLAKGTKPEDILKSAKQADQSDVSPDWTLSFGFVPDFLRIGPLDQAEPSISFTPPWQESKSKKALDTIRTQNADRQNKELGVVLKGMNDQQRQQVAQMISEDPNRPWADQGAFYQQLMSPQGLEGLFANFAKNPKDPFLNDAVSRTINWARGNLPPEIVKQLDDIAKQAGGDPELTRLQQEDTSGTLDEDIKTATERLKAGIGTPAEVTAAFNEKIKLLKGLLKATDDPRKRDALQLDIATFTKQRNDALLEYVKQQEDRFDKLQTAVGGEVTPQQTQMRALGHAQDTTLDPGTRYDYYTAYLQSVHDQMEKRVSTAQTAEEKLKILQEGIPIPPAVRQGVIQAGTEEGLSKYADQFGVSAAALSKFINDQAEKEGVSTNEILKTMLMAKALKLKAELTFLQKEKASLGSISKIAGIDKQVDDKQKELDGVLAQYDDLAKNPPQPGVDPGATQTATPEEIWNAAIEANKERAQKLEGLQDLGAAKLRDPISTAKANIEKARIARTVTDPNSVEFLQTQIDEQNAINQLADAQADITQAFYTLAESQTRDPLQKAKLGLDAARAAVANAHGDAEKMRALAAVNDAANAVTDAQDEIVQAMYSLAETRTRDPVQKAQYAVDAAVYMRDHAKGTADWLKAQQQVEQAIQQLQDAQNQIVQALYSLAEAQSTNPVQQAQYAVDAAQAAVASAHDTASQLQAMAQKVNADKQLREAIYNVANSQVELLEAYANAAGDTVAAAGIALTLARQKLDQVLATSPDDAAQVNRAKADVAAAERSSEDATLTQKQDDIQFALDMKQITQQQAIGMLQSLLAIPTNTLAQQRAIQRQIESLKGQLGQDFQFNLPSILGLPTMYEARRLSQGAAAGMGGYQDNRQISIQVFANTNADPNQIAAAVADVLGPPQTFGVSGRRY